MQTGSRSFYSLDMKRSQEKTRELLSEFGLRATAPRLAVLDVLMSTQLPLSHSEVLERLKNLGKTDWDPATVYRNLVKLHEAGVAPIASRVDGIDRYAIASTDGHQHPHFVCTDCGKVSCLPPNIATVSTRGAWAASVREATIQLRGECPDCRRAR